MSTTYLPIPQPTEETLAANRNRRDQQSEHCAVCHRGLTERAVENGWFIHLTNGGEMVPADIELHWEIDLGWHPVGSECAKLIPKTYRTKF